MSWIAGILLVSLSAAAAWAADPLYVRGKPLVGSPVVNRQGDRMGHLDDLIIGSTGRVEYIVIRTTSGIIGTVDGMYPRARGEDSGNVGVTELVAIPWVAGTELGRTGVVVDISKDKFDYAPSFREWAEFEDMGQPERARAYFGN